MSLTLVYDSIYTTHQTGYGHPEQPLRVVVIEDALKKAGLMRKDNTLKPRKATMEELQGCHTLPYLKLVQDEVDALKGSQDLRMLSTGDVVISAQSNEAALFAVGAALTAVDSIFKSPVSKAFCIVRPPGHHACISQGMGFCLYNNIAIAARYAQKTYGIKKALIVDWDVHHGNGTQEIFYNDPSVFYFSTHEKDLYPLTGMANETGQGAGLDTTLNCPIPASHNSRFEVIEAFANQLVEKMKTFQPEMVFISAGFDAHQDDPLGHFNLTTQDFGILTSIVQDVANKYCKGRIVSVLEGGYNLKALAESALIHAKMLAS